jgi:hypothetical protein
MAFRRRHDQRRHPAPPGNRQTTHLRLPDQHPHRRPTRQPAAPRPAHETDPRSTHPRPPLPRPRPMPSTRLHRQGDDHSPHPALGPRRTHLPDQPDLTVRRPPLAGPRRRLENRRHPTRRMAVLHTRRPTTRHQPRTRKIGTAATDGPDHRTRRGYRALERRTLPARLRHKHSQPANKTGQPKPGSSWPRLDDEHRPASDPWGDDSAERREMRVAAFQVARDPLGEIRPVERRTHQALRAFDRLLERAGEVAPHLPLHVPHRRGR